MPVTIKAWLSIGSTYTYLTALRLRSVVEASVIKLDIRPISIRQIMKNMDNIPFPPSKKTKVDYMWRDIQRRSEFYSLPVPNVPAPYPLQEFDRANLVGIVMERDGRYLEYLEETYRAWFLDGLEAGSDRNLENVSRVMGTSLPGILDGASSSEILEIYERNTAEAQTAGVFGAPSFEVNGEIFWGDDRLEDAILFAKQHQ
jgi:2-hydroxychromene-2-carboxylate isomerase